MHSLKECHVKGAPHLPPKSADTSLGLMPLTEGDIYCLVSSEEHLSVQSNGCVLCSQGVIDALLFSIALGGQISIQGFVSQQLGKEDRGEIGRQMVVPLAKEACFVDFPCNT